MEKLVVIGGGMAGCEAAWQAAKRGIEVDLYEMRPEKMTPAHQGEDLGELVCSNSLRSDQLENAVGLLKEEMRQLGSLIIEAAYKTRVPAGGALAVDRKHFANYVTEKCEKHSLINVLRGEVKDIPENSVTIIATGPLTSESMTESIKKFTGENYFYFYDAAAPIVYGDSVDMNNAFWASRYDKGDADYLNCPMSEEEYKVFYDELMQARKHEAKEFEKDLFFEGCMPVEEMGRRGYQTLLFGPLKPVGLKDPRSGEQTFAVVQLRKENTEGTMLNLVGFQTSLAWPEQKKVFSLIPALKDAEFVRYGMIHRNSFICSPLLLEPTYKAKNSEKLFFAGQITGVEGYVESASSGLVAGINAALLIRGQHLKVFPDETVTGALAKYVTEADSTNFQPMKANFGLLPPLLHKAKKKDRKNIMVSRSLDKLKNFME